MPALLLGAAGTLARRGSWPAAGLPDAAFGTSLDPDLARAFDAYFGGFRAACPLPVLYAYAQRAQLARMTRPDFPFRVPGLIHLANAQRLDLAPDPAAPLVLAVASRLVEPAEVPGRVCVELDVRFEQGGTPIGTCRSLYMLQRGARKPAEETEAPAADESWQLAADEGRRYAALSGDYNPVHLWPWTARWFGQPRPILHGMNALARVVAAVERGTGRPVSAIEVAFKRPIRLPAEVSLGWSATPGRFAVTSDAGPHLVGSYDPGL
jgi:hypothetical protein